MKKNKQLKSWLDKKLEDPKFRKEFEEEYEKLSIAEQLIKARLDANLTQAELAKLVGTTASAISRYENSDYGKYELQTLQKIVKACGAELKIMIETKNNKNAA